MRPIGCEWGGRIAQCGRGLLSTIVLFKFEIAYDLNLNFSRGGFSSSVDFTDRFSGRVLHSVCCVCVSVCLNDKFRNEITFDVDV